MGDRGGGAEAMDVDAGAPSPLHEEYSQLKDLKFSLTLSGLLDQDHSLRLGLWLYITPCLQLPANIIHQVGSDGRNKAPFLVLSKDMRITMYPLLNVQEDCSSSSSSGSLSSGDSDQPMGSSFISSQPGCFFSRWMHIGCEISRNFSRMYVDGNLVGEMAVSCLNYSGLKTAALDRLLLVGSNEPEGKLLGHLHDIQLLSKSTSITDHFLKSPPIQLLLDLSCVSDGVEDCRDGIWSVVGGKASCRRNFTVQVVLLDVFGRPVHRKMEIFALLVYADNGAPVEKTKGDTEGPLLINYEGIDTPSTLRPVNVVHGRATFRLKISQLSSKCDNRLFRVLFQSVDAQFIHAYSPPIQCISRNLKSRTSDLLRPKLTSKLQHGGEYGFKTVNGKSQDSTIRHKMCHLQMPDQSISEFAHSPKYAKPVSEMNGNVFGTPQQKSSDCCSLSLLADDENDNELNSGENFEGLEGMDDLPSDSESTDAIKTINERVKDIKKLLSDETTFRYCLEGTNERYVLLKEVGSLAAEQDIRIFAEQVALYSGCSHHRYQIMMSKQLIEEGISSWHAIAKGKNSVLWVDSLPEIIRRFRKISHSSRALTKQDIELLHEIADCGDDMNRENFNKLWSWLYPIALTISLEQINDLWECTSPKWIEGLITKDEAENALKFSGASFEPGTFVLRFPTSRSWPHPDAGSLVITYVGADLIIHNKLLTIDARNTEATPLSDLLLEEPELSKLATVLRCS